jgi:Pyridoxamine 5'-phosphate oxidase
MTVGKTYNKLDERLQGWIAAQHIFFVATAPSGPGGYVNLSPKGHADTLAVLDEQTVAYLDLTGSGAETVAHLRDNGWITLMFCAFSDPPRILRVYGQGRVVLLGDDRWEEVAARSPAAAAPVPLSWSKSSVSPTPAAMRCRSMTTPASVTCSTMGRTQGWRRPGRLPHPPQPQEHRRPPRPAYGCQ